MFCILIWLAQELIPCIEVSADTSSTSDFHFDGSSIPALMKLLQRAYFQRLWTLQEIALSQDSLVVCGQFALPWSTFAAGVHWIESWILEQKSAEDLAWLTPFKTFNDLSLKCEQMRESRGSNPGLITSKIRDVKEVLSSQAGLFPLLSTLRAQKASLAADKIFAIYSLMTLYMHHTDVRFPRPDYRQPAPHAYVDATLTWMVYSQNPLEILKMVPSSWQHARAPGIPSWVPDWSDSNAPRLPPSTHQFDASNSRGGDYRLERRENGFEVTALPNAETPAPSTRAPVGAPRLYVTAKVVGRVVRRSYRVMHQDYIPPLRSNDRIERELEDARRTRCLLDWFRFVNPMHTDVYKPTGEQVLTALYSVLFGLTDVDTKQEAYSPRMLLSLFDSSLLDNAPIEPVSAPFNAELVWSANPAAVSVAEAMCPRPSPPTYLHIYLAGAGNPDAIKFIRDVTKYTTENSLFETETGYLGSANQQLEPDDTVALLEGIDVPIILREARRRNEYTIVGPAYVHGAMHGEAWKTVDRTRRVTLL